MSKVKVKPKPTLLEQTMIELKLAIDANKIDQVAMILKFYDRQTGFYEIGGEEFDHAIPNPVSEKFDNGTTPLERAQLLGEEGRNICTLLIENGADVLLDS